MTKPITLGIDIDSTIWDSPKLYSVAAEELFGEGYKPEDVTHWYWLRDRYGENYWEIFNKALHPDWMERRELYPGVVECLTGLMEDYNLRIHFMTMNVNPDLMRKPLKKWLTDHFGDVGLSITTQHGPKNFLLAKEGAFGIVDDKYATVEAAADEGYYTAAMVHYHNQKDLEEDDRIDIFDEWDEADILLRLQLEKMRENSKKELDSLVLA